MFTVRKIGAATLVIALSVAARAVSGKQVQHEEADFATRLNQAARGQLPAPDCHGQQVAACGLEKAYPFVKKLAPAGADGKHTPDQDVCAQKIMIFLQAYGQPTLLNDILGRAAEGGASLQDIAQMFEIERTFDECIQRQLIHRP